MTTNTNGNTSDFHSLDFFNFLFRWWKHIIIIGVIAFIGAVVFSGPRFITPKFKSTSLMFPAATGNLYKSLLSDNPGGKYDFYEFGELEQAERLLEIVNSSRVRNYIIDTFNLWDHYGYKKGERYHQTWLLDEYKSNVKINRTNYGAVRIEVLDKDPQIASDMANAIANYANTFENKLRKERAMLALSVIETEKNNVEQMIFSIEDSLSILRKKGVYSYTEQIDRLSQRMAIEIANNNQSGIKNIQKQLDNLGQYGGRYVFLRHFQERLTIQLALDQSRLEAARLEAATDFPFHFIVDTAFPADKKSQPVRWLIVLFSTFAAVLTSIFALMFYQKLLEHGYIQQLSKKKQIKQ